MLKIPPRPAVPDFTFISPGMGGGRQGFLDFPPGPAGPDFAMTSFIEGGGRRSIGVFLLPPWRSVAEFALKDVSEGGALLSSRFRLKRSPCFINHFAIPIAPLN